MMRFLDAVGSSPNRAPVRTMYAQEILDRPDLDAIYIRMGGGIVARYKRSTFPPQGPLTFPYPSVQRNSGRGETILPPDAIFNIDLAQGWHRDSHDSGDSILTGFDVDDEGFVYIAATVFGWGVADAQMRTVFTSVTEQPAKILALKGAAKRYAIMSNEAKASIYDVTTRSAPVKLTAKVPRILSAAKTADGRAAIVDPTRTLSIFTADDLARAGSLPLFRQSGYSAVSSDGANFFALRGSVIDVLAPSTRGAYVVSSTQIDPSLTQINLIHYGSGHIVVTGVDTKWTWRVYRVSPALILSPVAIDFSTTVNVEAMNAVDGVVIGNRLVLSGKIVGEVYEMHGVPPPPPPSSTQKAPTIEWISPTSGMAGQTVTIRGANLEGATVTFSDTLTAHIVSNTAEEILVYAPPDGVGASNVRVTTPEGTTVVWNGYTYWKVIPPVIIPPAPAVLTAKRYATGSDAAKELASTTGPVIVLWP